MQKIRKKRTIVLSIVILLLVLTHLSCKKSPQPEEKLDQQILSEEAYPSEESLRLKREISQKIVRTNNKILLIGLDAADWLIIDPLINQGKLPHLARLKKEGAWGNLKSFPPILSPIVWTSIGTGKPPEKHGIADFMTIDTKTGKKVPISRLSRKVKAIWNILSDFGLSCDVIGWWATWPAERINGHIVTERISYNLFNLTEEDFEEEGKTYPLQLVREISPLLVGTETISFEEITRFIHVSRDEFDQAWKEAEAGKEYDNRINHLRKILASTKTFHNIALHLLKKGQTDFFSVYFEGIDTISHRFMLYMAPKLRRISDEDFRKYKDAIENFYIFQDELVGELLDSVDSETTVMVVSDHGFFSGGQRPMSEPDDFATGAQTWHRPVGVVILKGKRIKPGKIKGATIFDIAPTVLHLAGFPIPEDMNSKPLYSAFSSEFKGSIQVGQIDSYEKVNPIKQERARRLSNEDKQRMAELRALGYISGADEGAKSQDLSKMSSPSSKEFSATAMNHYNLGRAHLEKKQYAQAEEEFKKAISVDPSSQHALYFLAKTYEEQNRIEEAIEPLKKIISNNYDVFSETYILLTNLYVKKGQPEVAEKVLRSALVLKKEVSQIHSGLGFIHEKRGETDKAEEEYRKALYLNPLDFSAINRIFILYIDQNRQSEADAVIQETLSLHDVPDNILYDWGVMCLKHKRLDLAEKIFEGLLKKSPENPAVMVNLGFSYAYKGRLEEAKSLLKKAVEEIPDNPKILYNLGALCSNTGELEKALVYYERALEVGKGTPQIYNAMGRAYFQLGQKRSSLEILKKSLQLNPNQPDVKEMVQILEKELEGRDK
jgi:predicted AlkP superfamily phosphohydrolase/phosphomutase/Tfp pilus assembly protein PilF